MAIGKNLYEHSYPKLLLRRPRLIGLVHLWNNLVLQRTKAVNLHLRGVLSALPKGSLAVEAGCADGQYIFPFRRRFPEIRFLGIDKNPDNIRFCKSYTGHADTKGLEFEQRALEELSLMEQADLVVCVGTLHYIEDDVRVLRNFKRALKPQGRLLLYSPINGKTILPIYRYFFKKLGHYEKSQNRQRIYGRRELEDKLRRSGFAVSQQRFTYGDLGILLHEIYNLLLMGMGNSPVWFSWIFGVLAVVYFPIMLIGQWVDFHLPKKQGNGILLVAKPIESDS